MNPMNIIAKATSPKTPPSQSTPNIFGRETFDKLSLTNHPHFDKFIKKHGDKNEKLVYSNYYQLLQDFFLNATTKLHDHLL